MKALALTLIVAAVAAGCTRHVIVPAPAPAAPSVVTTPAISERVVEKQTPAAAGATSPAACTWASQSFSSGATSCQDHAQFRCNNGSWERTAVSC